MRFSLRRLSLLAVFFAHLLGRSPLSAEIVELKTGHKIEGDVLKQQADILFIDIGIDVLRVPLNQIKARIAPNESGTQTALVQKHQLYRTAQLPRRSIKELTEKFGEGVVLVQTPGGLGSGFIVNENGF